MEIDNHDNYQGEYDDNEIIDEEDQEIVNGNIKDELNKNGSKISGNEKMPPNIQIKPLVQSKKDVQRMIVMEETTFAVVAKLIYLILHYIHI